MTEYSVKTNNRFQLTIDEDEDLYELLEKQQEEAKQKRELAAEQAAKAKALASKSTKGNKGSVIKSQKRVSKNVTTDNKTTQNVAKTTYPPRNDENRPPRFARQARDGPNDSNMNFEKPPQDFTGRERRGGYGGRGRGGMRGGGGNRPRREFERHSGSDKTGIKAVEKRDGSGPHNWGDEIQAQLEHPDNEQQKLDTTTEQTEPSAENEGALENGLETSQVEPVEEGPKEMTLDEWRASQTKTTAKSEFKVRKANEGTDTKQWKGTVALQRKKKGDHSEEEYEYTDDEEEQQEVDETKANLEKLHIEITFADNSRPGSRGRGGRGRGYGPPRGPRAGGRGGRGGYERRGGDNRYAAVPLVDNEKEFPSLGSK